MPHVRRSTYFLLSFGHTLSFYPLFPLPPLGISPLIPFFSCTYPLRFIALTSCIKGHSGICLNSIDFLGSSLNRPSPFGAIWNQTPTSASNRVFGFKDFIH
eukprot:Gb_40550 [translate_table: standard]